MLYEILVDRSETPTKCSILPLAGRDDLRGDLRILRFDRRYPIRPLTGRVLLHPDGELLEAGASPGGEAFPLSAIDCNWRRLDRILAKVTAPLPPLVRIPDGFTTAYRRRNKRDLDPGQGLATVEAVFLAAAFLGRWDERLLAEYTERQAFLEANAEAFARHGLTPPREMAG